MKVKIVKNFDVKETKTHYNASDVADIPKNIVEKIEKFSKKHKIKLIELIKENEKSTTPSVENENDER